MSGHAKVGEFAKARAALREDAETLIAKLDSGEEEVADEAVRLTSLLRSHREFDLLEKLADAVRTYQDAGGIMTKWLAQALIEQGRARLAVDVLGGLLTSLPKANPAWIDASGVLGRAWKQLFFDTSDKQNQKAQESFQKAVNAYAAGYEASGRMNEYVGINLAALLAYGERNGIKVQYESDSRTVAMALLEALNGRPEASRDEWYHASMAETAIALGDWENAKKHIAVYVQSPRTDAFALSGTIRQFTDLWCLGESGEIGQAILEALRAETLDRPGGNMDITAEAIERIRTEQRSPHLEVILGHDGLVPYRLLKKAVDRALSVAAIEHDGSGRVGTGFIVRGGDFVPALGDEPCLLTNAHVVNADPQLGFAPDECAAVFEVPPPGISVRIVELLWWSPENELDAALLRLAPGINSAPPLPLARNLPLADGKQRVYIIGHPLGRELTYSIQDNVILEHEGPPAGTPVAPNVRKLHYRTPTEPGSSGSPVFNSSWKVIGLHRAGGNLPRLNGHPGSWEANEGVWIRCIADAALTTA